MKTRFHFEIMDLDDSLVAVPVGAGAEQFHGVLKLNETAAVILKHLEQDITEKEIVDLLLKEYSGDRDKIASYVHEYIEALTAEDILD